MKLFLVIDETYFFHPTMVSDLIQQIKGNHDLVGAARVVSIPPNTSLDLYLKKNWWRLNFFEITKLVAFKIFYGVADFLYKKFLWGKPRSVASVLESFQIPFFDVHLNINQESYLNEIRARNPDIIISSNSLIFKDELLKIPTVACINRHSSLLPSYGGIWPVFQAMRNGDSCVGVSVHTMTNKIDEGIILSQIKIPIISGNSLFDLYEKCFSSSSVAIVEAIEKLKGNQKNDCRDSSLEPSYFSQPKPEHWDAFRAKGYRFV